MYNLMLGKKKKFEVGLKQASEMNVFLKVWRVWGPWRHTSPHTPLGCPSRGERGHRPVLLRPFQRKVSFWEQFSYNTFVLHSDLVCIAMQRDSSSQRFVTKKLWIFICIFVKCTEDSINHLLPLKFIKRSVLSVLCQFCLLFVCLINK